MRRVYAVSLRHERGFWLEDAVIQPSSISRCPGDRSSIEGAWQESSEKPSQLNSEEVQAGAEGA